MGNLKRGGMRLVVKQHRPLRQFLFGGISMIAAIAIGWMIVDYSQWLYIYERMSGNVEQRELWDRNRQLRKELAQLEERYAVLKRSSQIDRKAQLEVQRVIQKLQDQLHERHAELEFYRGVLAATKEGQGLRVQGFRVEPYNSGGRFFYSLVLTRVGKDDRVAEGEVAVWLEGSASSHPSKLKLTELSPGSEGGMLFELKHFRRFEGEFVLPEAFLPDKIRVRVTLQKPKGEAVERVFSWEELLES